MHSIARVLLVLASAVFVAAASAATAPNAARVGAYDFAYLLGGDAAATKTADARTSKTRAMECMGSLPQCRG